MLGTKLQPMNISNHGLSLAFILTFINQYFQGAEGKRMMGKSKNNPQPNQIEGREEKGKSKTHTNTPKRREETWESEAILLLPQSGNYC